MNVFLSVVGLGLAFFAAPGPINIETVRQGVNGGAWPAFSLQLGAIVAELLIGVAVFVGIVPFMEQPAVQLMLALCSAAVLLWIAWRALRDTGPVKVPHSPIAAARHSFVIGLTCALTNPLSALMWLTIAGVAAISDVAALAIGDALLIGAGYLLGALTWAVLIALFIGWSRHLIRPQVWRWWNALSGLAIGGYGVQMLWAALPG